MSRENEKLLLAILDQALAQPPEDQPAFLDAACGDDPTLRQDVESLLETRGSGLLPAPFFDAHAADAGVGRTIGPYRLVRLLGRGGMGAVYLAEREDFAKRVGLKLIKRGLDKDEAVVRRFHTERQILARLDHPGIARLLDGGTTEDHLPYFVMEYVRGEPIDRFCAARQLLIRDRLALFCKVCSAVHFAHRNLVVHRDLKPGNILVTGESEPKLLDFGIAKLLDHGLDTAATVPGDRPMTPRYASPEQIRGEVVTTASDVYALGVLLYELLTGRYPYEVSSGSDAAIARAICDEVPPPPSAANSQRRRLSGDLDAIVAKAMHKEPQDRYSSAAELAEDVRRHLDGLPVTARTWSFAYSASRFARRHKLGLATSVVFVLLLTAFAVVSTVLWRQAERQGQRAEKASEFLEDLIQGADPDRARGTDLTAVELLERGVDRIAEDLRGEPELQIDFAGTLGEVFRNLGDYGKSRKLMEQSLAIARRHYPGDHPEVAKRLSNLGVLVQDQGDYDTAERLLREALAMRQRLGEDPTVIFRMKSNLAGLLMERGELEQAEELYRKVLTARRELYGPDDPDVATSLRNLAACHHVQGKTEEAEPLLREALEIRRRLYGPENTRVASVLDLLGRVLAAQGRREEAKAAYDEALEIRRRRLEEGHPTLAQTKKNLAALLLPGDPATAEVLLSEALASFERSRSPRWKIAEVESLLGACLVELGRYDEAEGRLIESYETLKEIRGERSIYARDAYRRVLVLYESWGRPEKLEEYRALDDP